jgi:hypothetical protein
MSLPPPKQITQDVKKTSLEFKPSTQIPVSSINLSNLSNVVRPMTSLSIQKPNPSASIQIPVRNEDRREDRKEDDRRDYRDERREHERRDYRDDYRDERNEKRDYKDERDDRRDYRDERDDKRDESSDDESSDDEPKSSKYKISNLITLFNKNSITLHNIFTYRKRVMFLLVSHEVIMYSIYIPSKYEMYIDRSLGIPTYELADDEEEEEDTDTLFYNRLPIENIRRTKVSKSKSLQRFLPLVTESPIKMMYIDEGFISYISRQNTIDSLLLLSPCKLTGYYYITDLEFFFKNLPKLLDEFTRFERALNDAVYDRLTTELDVAKNAITKAQKMIVTLKPKEEKIGFATAIHKLNKYVQDEKSKEKAKDMLVKLRNKNLNKMFEIENITYVMKEFK